MGQQSIRQEARRVALDAQSKLRRERAEREKRLEGLAVRVLVAVAERDAAVVDAERRAGKALHEMTEDEGLSVREAVQWCGGEISTREATRLRHLVKDNRADGFEVCDMNSAPGAAEEAARGSVLKDARGHARS